MPDPSKPSTAQTQPEPDLSAFAVFDPEAGQALIRRRLDLRAEFGAAQVEFPPLMGEVTLTKAVADQWKALRDADRQQRDRPDPWPVIERNFPHIAATIRENWGKRWLDDYLGKLVIDERGSRQGFNLDTLSAIMEIARLHSEQFGLEKPLRPWEANVGETKWWYKR
jgi:hypothetical protein